MTTELATGCYLDLYSSLFWASVGEPERYGRRKDSPGQRSLFGDEPDAPTAPGRHDVSQEARDASGRWTAGPSAAERPEDSPAAAVDQPASVATLDRDETIPSNEQVKGGPVKRVAKTKSGIDVSMESDVDGTRITVNHPQAGKIEGRLTHWDKQKGVAYTDAYYKGQKVGLSISKDDYDAAVEDVTTAKQKQVDDIKNGNVLIDLHYHDGEYLSGHSVSGPAADLLVQLGVAKDVGGWGTHVEHGLVDALGTSFTYQQAADFAKPRLDAKQAKQDAANQARDSRFAEAKQTGKPVLLHHYTEAVSGREEEETENSMNVVYVYAMPDGTTKTTRHGTY